MFKLSRTICCIVCLLIVSGCSSIPSAEKLVSAGMEHVVYSHNADITAYQQEIDAIVTGSVDNEYLKAIVADDVLTADEMNEFVRRVKQCYAQRGYNFSYDVNSGTSTVSRLDEQSVEVSLEDLDKVTYKCSDDTGYSRLVVKYDSAVYNPKNLDLKPYVVQCLIDHDLVDQSYSIADYVHDSQQRSGPFEVLDDESADVQKRNQTSVCVRDPLGNME